MTGTTWWAMGCAVLVCLGLGVWWLYSPRHPNWPDEP